MTSPQENDAGGMDKRLSDEIDRIIAEYRRWGYDRAAICSRSFEIEEQARNNLAEEDGGMSIEEERDRAAGQRWLEELEAAREAVEALGGAGMEPAAERDLDHIHLILDQMRDRELERVDPTKKAAVAINPLPAYSTVSAVRSALDSLDFRPVRTEDVRGWGKGYLDDCEEAVSLNLRFTVEKDDGAWSLYVTPDTVRSMPEFASKMIHRVDDLPSLDAAIEAAEDFRAVTVARVLNVPPIKEPDWHLMIQPAGREGMTGHAAPHIAVLLAKDKAGSPAEVVHSIYLHQRPSASVFELTQEAGKWAEGFRAAMSKTQPDTRVITHTKPMEWSAGPSAPSHLQRSSLGHLRGLDSGAEDWISGAKEVRGDVVKLGASSHKHDNLFICDDHTADAALRASVDRAVQAVDHAIGVVERYQEKVREAVAEKSAKPQQQALGAGPSL